MFTSLRTQCGSIAELWSSRAANVNEAADAAEGPAPGAESLRAAFASCPVCAKHARPRQYNVSAVDCVSEHIKAKARAGDALHTSLHRCLHADAATIERNTSGGPYGRPTRPVGPVAGSEEGLAAVAEMRTRHVRTMVDTDADEESRAVAEALFPREAQAEAAAAASLYAAAKMGGERGARWVAVHLFERNANPNAQHDDGFTPLMTASEAGHAEVVRLLRIHPACNANLRNAYGQAALHFAAQNGRADAVDALLEEGPAGASAPADVEQQ